ncbi:VOC family protein [Pseudooceanicola nitratireducens]|uniref:VOC family protein n=1 Tax=Pseudooceanicola nitratireducens TaxID=517719 RepID=UPI001C964C99|nr:VOC family protein [Pseudooceanicola nitratireducens]MBY6157905.1 VOC family protein [Pseudooceanicola nitratireducens]
MILLEHVNVTVSDPDATAAWLAKVFGWHIRWSGPAMQTGRTVHVGTPQAYVALFSHGETQTTDADSYRTVGMLNHLAVFTDEDIDAVEGRVTAAGFTPINHNDYAPGRRFYFHDSDGIEWEVASHQG